MNTRHLYGPSRVYAGLAAEQAAYATARAVVLPAPYDATTTFRGGAREGPRAIVDASMQLELYDIELQREIAAAGIHTLPELEPHLGGPQAMVHRAQEAAQDVLRDGKLPVMLGGEHTLTAGAVAACAALHPDLRLLYLDAHADVRGPYLGATFNHASALRLALDAIAGASDRSGRGPTGGQGAPAAVAVGVRSLAVEEVEFIGASGLPVVYAEHVAATRHRGQAALERLWQSTLERLGPPGCPLYVSVDLDAFDPSLVPAVGTPEPGGLEWYEVLALLRAAARRHPIVMADVMELAPDEGPVASAFTAAKLVYKLIGYGLYGRER